MTEGRTLPLLQDASPSAAWGPWAVTYRDVVIVDGAGVKRDVFNVTVRDLAQSSNYTALKQRLLEARSP